MAITKTTEIGKIEVVSEYKHVQVRTDTVIKEDGAEISRTFHRHVLHPDMDISGEHAEVQAVANAAWTDDVKAAWKTFQDNQKNPGE
jgi:hypothetical protein|tara:strand:+ start:258 stop:518 length:261 start_codon:yes stop_codon:yes gene_type:complete